MSFYMDGFRLARPIPLGVRPDEEPFLKTAPPQPNRASEKIKKLTLLLVLLSFSVHKRNNMTPCI